MFCCAFVEDDPRKARARRHVGAATADEPCIINSVVLAEFAWALAKKMKQKRAEVARLIEEVLSADDSTFLIGAPWSAHSPLTAQAAPIFLTTS